MAGAPLYEAYINDRLDLDDPLRESRAPPLGALSTISKVWWWSNASETSVRRRATMERVCVFSWKEPLDSLCSSTFELSKMVYPNR